LQLVAPHFPNRNFFEGFSHLIPKQVPFSESAVISFTFPSFTETAFDPHVAPRLCLNKRGNPSPQLVYFRPFLASLTFPAPIFNASLIEGEKGKGPLTEQKNSVPLLVLFF